MTTAETLTPFQEAIQEIRSLITEPKLILGPLCGTHGCQFLGWALLGALSASSDVAAVWAAAWGAVVLSS